jgi:hypothetical protein
MRGVMRRDERAVSSVLGAILMFGLLVLTLVLVQTRFVPVWEKQREEDGMMLLAGQAAAIKSDLDRLASNQTSVPLSDPVTLLPQQGFTFFTTKTLPGTATFAPAAAGTGFSLVSNPLTILQQGGTPLYALNEDWTTFLVGQSKTNVQDIVHLRLRINDPTDADGSLTLTMTNAAGSICYGRLEILVQTLIGSDRNVQISVFGATAPPSASCNATPITIHNEDAKKQTAPAFTYVDAFDPELQFGPVMAAATYPLTVSLAGSGTLPNTPVPSSATIVYDDASGTRVGASGIPTNYNTVFPSGTLSVGRTNNQFPAQTYTVEYGAVILDQPDGSAMAVPPAFHIASSQRQTGLDWSFAALSGSSNSVTGGRSATTVFTPTGARTALEAVAPQIAFTLSTTHGALWKSYWDQTLQLAGLTPGSYTPVAPCLVLTPGPQYRVDVTATSATLTVFGPCPAAGDTTNDLSLTFQQAAVNVVLRPSG